jgi:hypothetical protein
MKKQSILLFKVCDLACEGELACGCLFVCLSELEQKAPTKQKLASLVKMVGNWRKDVMIWSSEKNLLKLAHIELELAEIRKALGGHAEEDPFNPAVVEPRGRWQLFSLQPCTC